MGSLLEALRLGELGVGEMLHPTSKLGCFPKSGATRDTLAHQLHNHNVRVGCVFLHSWSYGDIEVVVR